MNNGRNAPCSTLVTFANSRTETHSLECFLPRICHGSNRCKIPPPFFTAGEIVPLAAYCETMRGCVAALVILPQVGRCWHQCSGGEWLATVRRGYGAMRCIRCLRVGGSLRVDGTGAVIVPVSTD